MSNLAFDTHKFVTDLSKAGMSTEQAEDLANHYASLLNDRIATKDDLRQLRTELSGEIGTLRTELRGDMAAMEERLNRRIVTGQLTTILAVCAILGTIIVLIQP